MPANEELTQVERDKREIDPNIDFREIAATPFNIPSRSNAFREAALNARDRMLGRGAPRGVAPLQLSLHSDG